MRRTPQIPQHVLNILGSARPPLAAQLDGPGPFELPRLESVISLDLDGGTGTVRMATAQGQEVRLPLSAKALDTLKGLLDVRALKQRGA